MPSPGLGSSSGDLFTVPLTQRPPLSAGFLATSITNVVTGLAPSDSCFGKVRAKPHYERLKQLRLLTCPQTRRSGGHDGWKQGKPFLLFLFFLRWAWWALSRLLGRGVGREGRAREQDTRRDFRSRVTRRRWQSRGPAPCRLSPGNDVRTNPTADFVT